MSTGASQGKRPLRNEALAAQLFKEFKEMFSTEEQTKQMPGDGGWSPYFRGADFREVSLPGGVVVRELVKPGAPPPSMEPIEPIGGSGYSGREWFWNVAYKHSLRDANEAVRKAVHDGMIIYGLDPVGATPFHDAIVEAVLSEGTTKVYRDDIF